MKLLKSSFLIQSAISLGISVVIAKVSFAQTVPIPKIESPNTASLGKYGDVPVSYFTGVPNISLPLYNINVGNINTPISLSYHSGAVKPNEHPGWVGLGWNLNTYGKITRVGKMWLDEGNNSSPNVYPFYPDPTYHPGGDGATFINTTDWDEPQRIGEVFGTQQTQPQTWYDAISDEFSFNFGGYSGTFYYTANGWQVVSENTNIKIQELGFMDHNEISQNLVNYINGFGGLGSQEQSRMFRGFILTTEDGTKYTFGCISASGFDVNCGVEFKARYATDNYGLEANSWLLRKIEDINGQVVTYEYQKMSPTCAISFYTSQTSYECIYDWASYSGGSSGPVKTALHSGFLLYPVYLKKITTSKEIISFKILETTELRYTDPYFRYASFDPSIPGLIEFDISASAVNNDVNNLKWYQLDSITIRNNANELIKKVKFNFSNLSTLRLTLNSVSEQDQAGANIKNYQFAYDNINGLPPYGGDQTDHWGFYNGANLDMALFPNLIALRATNSTLITRGLLSSITYPTGGRTEYVWESNKAANVIAINRQSITAYTPGFVGGCRIREIRNYTDPAATALTTKYYYVKNFAVGTDPSTLPSSGILNGAPKYNFNIPTRTGVNGLSTIAYFLESVNSLVSYSYNGSSSHVGYSEVVEQKPDNSYIKYHFTNFDQDLNAQTHWDQLPGVIGWVIGSSEDSYVTMSSLELERGKPLMTAAYNSNNVLLEKTNLYYRTDAARFNDFIKMYDLRYSLGCQDYDALVLASAYRVFKYNYYVVKEVKTVYDMNGANPVVTTSDFEYNTTNQLSKSTVTVSNGRKLITRYKYPSDFNISTAPTWEVQALQSMKIKNIITPPVEVQTLQEVSSVQTLVAGTIAKFKDFGNGLIKPAEELEMELASPSSVLTQCSINGTNQFVYHTAYKSKVLYDSYEINGGITQYHKKDNSNNSYLWDYNKNYPVAEVMNASQADIAYTSFEADGKGNWIYSGITSINPAPTTGLRSYSLTTTYPISKTGLTSGTTYLLSYWTLNASAFIISGTQSGYPIAGRTINGWKYYEHKITGVTSINISGTGLIDELRLYPYGAKMTTYTYTPVVGIKSQCDPNNRISYYEYDEFKRLMLIRDEDKSIVRQICYNYAGQPENCNIFYSVLRNGTYYKQGCTGCLVGSAVTYTIPAKMYSASTQLAADQLAINDMNANGQAYANANGTCPSPGNVTVSGTNGISTKSFSLQFHNNCTNVNYSFTLNPSATNVPLTGILQGNYTVTISAVGGGSTQYTYMVNGFTQHTMVASITVDLVPTGNQVLITP